MRRVPGRASFACNESVLTVATGSLSILALNHGLFSIEARGGG